MLIENWRLMRGAHLEWPSYKAGGEMRGQSGLTGVVILGSTSEAVAHARCLSASRRSAVGIGVSIKAWTMRNSNTGRATAAARVAQLVHDS